MACQSSVWYIHTLLCLGRRKMNTLLLSRRSVTHFYIYRMLLVLTVYDREVIERKPEQFKISCMRDISALFPPATNPFCAGFGNKINVSTFVFVISVLLYILQIHTVTQFVLLPR